MDPLQPLDAAMMTAELLSDPLHTAALLILSPPPDAAPGYVDALYRDALTATAELDPRFRRHPHVGLDTAGLWMWRSDDTVDMRDHLHRRTLSSGADREALWELISALHSEPLDRSRPMWMAYVIDGLPDGGFAFYIKVHHTVVDGVAGLKLIADAFSTDPASRSMQPLYAAAPAPPARDGDGPPGPMPNPLSLLRATTDVVVSGVGIAGRVVLGGLATALGRFADGTSALPVDAPYTRFNGRLGRHRTFAGVEFPKSRIRAVQNMAAVTANDVVMAVVSGVLREWLDARGELPGRGLVAICPVTVRARDHVIDEDRQANLFGLQLCPLGTDLADPGERLTHIHRAMARAKRQVAHGGPAATMLLAAPSIAATVLPPIMPFAPRVRRGYNVSISNVPGPPSRLYWNGALLEEIYPVSTAINGQALNVTMCSYADRVTFGYVSGRRVISDVGSLIPLTKKALAELEAAVGATAEET